ncbi:ABC transporter ATP-binding protein, partial [Pseudomonas syringae]|uniref:ATP-binding cassette domain-containing protein n=1 Tax=Pseudomonas syringae TaxID=317 RepID=UPI001F07CC85
MGFFIERVYFENRAPFDVLDLSLEEREVAVLTATNGRGKTTILSHIVDAFHEFAKTAYAQEFSKNPGAFYRLSTHLAQLDFSKHSIFYMRCRIN